MARRYRGGYHRRRLLPRGRQRRYGTSFGPAVWRWIPPIPPEEFRLYAQGRMVKGRTVVYRLRAGLARASWRLQVPPPPGYPGYLWMGNHLYARKDIKQLGIASTVSMLK